MKLFQKVDRAFQEVVELFAAEQVVTEKCDVDELPDLGNRGGVVGDCSVLLVAELLGLTLFVFELSFVVVGCVFLVAQCFDALVDSREFGIDRRLTSSTCHPKFVGKERCDALMTFHEHCFADCLLVLRKVYLYCYDCLCERQHFVDAHPDL